HLANPTGYGRIKRAEKVGFHIVEEKEASLEEKKIKEVNSGLYLLRTSFLLQELKKISAQNKAHEFYLTDLFKAGISVDLCVFDQADDFQGVNDLKQLEEVESFLLKRKKQSLQEQGVRFLHSPSVIIDWDVKISAGTQIHAGVELRGKTVVAGDVIIESGCIIKNSCIEKSAVIKAYSYIEEAQVGSFATVGPFARLRAETFIGEFAKIGNFVELKKVKLHKGVKISHLSYVGDAEVGENTNIGCGFITCNYDGAEKHFSEIGADTFIGSDTQLIAPIKIGNKVYIASGSTINQDIPDEGFAIARTRQVTKEKMSSRFIKNKNNT
ncbi:MAG: bifunctional N-acetylglucosamine-1-phosphate uridyltransferase/glucosamine-1-phosphate acetyltransferase, partial [Bacteriovoracaceae bacterium]|nr:bifunctional N-acetylglucosamine-1-phosphate uridyltransferase/glucosamine-1-phosphate acetyltransferase [Bacteriovoracaceae bacterium]